MFQLGRSPVHARTREPVNNMLGTTEEKMIWNPFRKKEHIKGKPSLENMRKRSMNVGLSEETRAIDRAYTYILNNGVGIITPQDFTSLAKNNRSASFCIPRNEWKDVLGFEPDKDKFVEVTFQQQGVLYPATIARVLISFDEDEEIIHAQWYPDGDILIDKERSIEICHLSSLKPSMVLPYFLEPKLSEEFVFSWDSSCFYDDNLRIMYVTVGQDHYFEWRYLEYSESYLKIEQIWLEKYRSLVEVKLEESSIGTNIIVTISGIISLDLEREYRGDLEGLAKIP
jgi:uncharacterized protein YciU (UPF0263 family)